MCGGTLGWSYDRDSVSGLSPRVRGNPGNVNDHGVIPRSIPACAGEPGGLSVQPSPRRVYPRVCGGTTDVGARVMMHSGLSPRVRGNHEQLPRRVLRLRSIPACAGEPSMVFDTDIGLKVYPRVCGGTPAPRAPVALLHGLSPRVRGNRRPRARRFSSLRSIPACAGEPAREGPLSNLTKVYPRVCGGTALLTPARLASSGLSPRVRGNRGRTSTGLAGERSIPACAGEPSRTTRPDAPAEVYPRVCGGTDRRFVRVKRPLGLSPRVRGNPIDLGVRLRPDGSIPACAGEPGLTLGGGNLRGVYPRVCGGTVKERRVKVERNGLSPRVRGNRGLRPGGAGTAGSIPACAGEPRQPSSQRFPGRVYPRVCGGTSRLLSLARVDAGLSPRVRGNLLL